MRIPRPRVSGRVAAAVAALLVPLAFAGSALAGEPTGEYAIFKNCPYEKTEVKQCVYSETLSGKVILGNQEVPIKNKILLQGGSRLNLETGNEEFFAAKTGTESLQKVAQSVPNGLLGIVGLESVLPWWLRPLYKAVNNVEAVTELAKPASEIGISAGNLIAEEGTALKLPVKVHLENLLLGSSCYIGSSTSPITWQLTSGSTKPEGPNKSIKGTPGELSLNEAETILTAKGYELVDNAFSAPAASGCGGLFSIIINPIVDLKIGLASPDGKNTAILAGNLKRAVAGAVRTSAE
jgi:hypothetical protein